MNALNSQDPWFTVVLAYPDSGGSIETYIDAVQALNAVMALHMVRQLAYAANDGEYAPGDFELIAAFKGNLVPELVNASNA